MITLNYTIEKQDYVAFYTYVNWNAKGRKKQLWKSILSQVSSVFVYGIILYSWGNFGKHTNAVYLILFLILGLCFLPLINGKNQIMSQAIKIAGDPDNASFITNYSLIANETELQIKTPFTDSKINWRIFIKKIETDLHYFLFENAMQAIIIPKRAFANNEEKITFDKILSRNLSLDAEIKDALP
jgi:YcxB-like protein